MKIWFLAILTTLLPVTALHAQFAYVNDDGYITITGYTGSGGAVTIPASINGFPVTTIADSAFFDKFTVTSVFIPSNVASISTRVFELCPALTNISVDPANTNYSSVGGVLFDINQQNLISYPGGRTGGYAMPNTVTNIWEYALSYATNLTGITISTNTLEIGEDAFYGSSLTNVFIPASVLSIGPQAFVCLPLTNISVDSSNTAFSSSAGVLFDKHQDTLMEYPQARPGAYTVSNTVTTINGFAFEFSSGLTSITLPASVTSIGDLPFLDCTNLTNIAMAASNTVYSSTNGVLFNAAMTTLLQYPPGLAGNYTVPDGVTSIGSLAIDGNAFYDCFKLTGVTFPNTVTTIAELAFHSCIGLTNVTIPASVTGIGLLAFEGCTGLTNFTVAPGNTVFTNESGVLYNLPPTVLFIYPPGKAGSYTIPDTVSAIDSDAFLGCINLTGVSIPGTVTNIGQQAFYSCTSLAAVTIPGSVTTIGTSAFEGCHALTNLTISNGVTIIPPLAFFQCDLTTVSLPNSVTNIQSEAFDDCPRLATVFLGPNVTSIGEDAFTGCASLQGVYFAGDAPPADTNAFSVFADDTNAIAYYFPGTTGWVSTFENIPTAPWLPKLTDSGVSYGAQTNQFGFNINWAGNETVSVEACTNPAAPVWQSVGSAVLVNGAASFSDPQWKQYPKRIYRVSDP